MNISWYKLALGYVLLVIPVIAFYYYRTKLVNPLLVSVLRLSVQLALIGFYLEYLFKYDSSLLNLAWVILMVTVTAFTVSSRSEVSRHYLALPLGLSFLTGLVITEFILLFVVLDLGNVFTARYLIPITGMILGNSLNTSIISLRSYYTGLVNNDLAYRYLLSTGATPNEAALPYLRAALKEAFTPVIANAATIGLVTLPGMMTGQILGGSSPVTAIKYQILIMLAIITGTVISVILGIVLSKRFALTELGMLKPGVMVEND